MLENVTKRDARLDCVKGIAISLVVIGHILQFGYTNDFRSLFVFDIIWTLQIPLFMVISGYFAGGGLTKKRILRKAKCYLIPFISCFLISELVVRGNTNIFTRIEELFYHLEMSLWYLFVLFELSLVHMVAISVATRINKNATKLKILISYTIAYGVLLVPFAVIAVNIGTTFLGSKYVLYYSIFYWIGFAWRYIAQILENKDENKKQVACKSMDAITLVAICAYALLLSYFNIAELGEGVFDIIVRFCASICGVYVTIRSVYVAYQEDNLCWQYLRHIGSFTLEIYYLHYLFIPYIADIEYSIGSPLGLFSVTFLYFVVMAICGLGVVIANSSKYLSLILFGKIKN